MDAIPIPTMRLRDLPLWRLLVALDDAERTVGASSPTARALARAIQERLRRERRAPTQDADSVREEATK
jgi:hypothetical protein